jgi:hypothetical protein
LISVSFAAFSKFALLGRSRIHSLRVTLGTSFQAIIGLVITDRWLKSFDKTCIWHHYWSSPFDTHSFLCRLCLLKKMCLACRDTQ